MQKILNRNLIAQRAMLGSFAQLSAELTLFSQTFAQQVSTASLVLIPPPLTERPTQVLVENAQLEVTAQKEPLTQLCAQVEPLPIQKG